MVMDTEQEQAAQEAYDNNQQDQGWGIQNIQMVEDLFSLLSQYPIPNLELLSLTSQRLEYEPVSATTQTPMCSFLSSCRNLRTFDIVGSALSDVTRTPRCILPSVDVSLKPLAELEGLLYPSESLALCYGDRSTATSTATSTTTGACSTLSSLSLIVSLSPLGCISFLRFSFSHLASHLCHLQLFSRLQDRDVATEWQTRTITPVTDEELTLEQTAAHTATHTPTADQEQIMEQYQNGWNTQFAALTLLKQLHTLETNICGKWPFFIYGQMSWLSRLAIAMQGESFNVLLPYATYLDQQPQQQQKQTQTTVTHTDTDTKTETAGDHKNNWSSSTLCDRFLTVSSSVPDISMDDFDDSTFSSYIDAGASFSVSRLHHLHSLQLVCLFGMYSCEYTTRSLRYMTHLKELRIFHQDANTADCDSSHDVDAILQLTQLTQLILAPANQITTQQIQQIINTLTQLQHLAIINNTNITDETLQTLQLLPSTSPSTSQTQPQSPRRRHPLQLLDVRGSSVSLSCAAARPLGSHVRVLTSTEPLVMTDPNLDFYYQPFTART